MNESERRISFIMEGIHQAAGEQKNGKNQKRDYNIECLRVVSCFFVVCIHVANYYSRGYGEISMASYVFSLMVNGVARTAVPVFFMISGSLLIPEPVSLKKCLKRTLQMSGTLILWSGIYLVWNAYYRGTEYSFRQILDRPVKLHLWYLYVLIGIYLVLPFLQSMFDHMPKSLYPYFALLWAGFLCVNELLEMLHVNVRYPVPIVGDACYLGYFVMGYLVKQNLEHVPLKAKSCGLLSAVCLFIAIGETFFASWSRGAHVEHFFEYRNIWIALGGVMLFTAVLKKSDRQYGDRVKAGIDFISRHSFTIYLCHVLFLDIVKLEMYPRKISAFVGIPVFVTGIFSAALLFSLVWDGVQKKIKDKKRRWNGKAGE